MWAVKLCSVKILQFLTAVPANADRPVMAVKWYLIVLAVECWLPATEPHRPRKIKHAVLHFYYLCHANSNNVVSSKRVFAKGNTSKKCLDWKSRNLCSNVANICTIHQWPYRRSFVVLLINLLIQHCFNHLHVGSMTCTLVPASYPRSVLLLSDFLLWIPWSVFLPIPF